MKQILLLEAKKVVAQRLVTLIEQMEEQVKIEVVREKKEAYAFAMDHDVNLFITGIILDSTVNGDTSGLTFAESIRKIERYKFTPLIIITSLSDPKMYAYQYLHCYSYIEKPFLPEEVQRIIHQALEFPQKMPENQNVYFRNEGIIYAYRTKDIRYIENANRCMKIYSKDCVNTFPYKSCKEILNQLSHSDFIQCSRSGIVNKKYIQMIDKGNRYIKVQGMEKKIEIGTVIKKQFIVAIGYNQ